MKPTIKSELLASDTYLQYEILYIFKFSLIFITLMKSLNCIVTTQNEVLFVELFPIFRLSFALLLLYRRTIHCLGWFGILLIFSVSRVRFIYFLTLVRAFDLVYCSLLTDVCILDLFTLPAFGRVSTKSLFDEILKACKFFYILFLLFVLLFLKQIHEVIDFPVAFFLFFLIENFFFRHYEHF